MSKYTNKEVAENFELWGEYFDTNGEMSREQFDAMDVNGREQMIQSAFGTDEQQAEIAGKK